MSEQEIIEGNKLIAEFEGYIPCEKQSIFDYVGLEVSIHALRYERDWDWLMPVVFKIMQEDNNLILHNYEGGYEAVLETENGAGGYDKEPIMAVWIAVTTYLKNKQH